MTSAALPQLPRICIKSEGVPCQGGCEFLILAGEPIWPGRRCTFCKRWHDQAERRRCAAA